MKKVKSLFFCWLTAQLLLGQPSWQPLNNAPNFIGQFSKLDDVHFINPEIGWTINATGEVYKTENGGIDWESKGNLGEFLRCVKFANENVGYIGSLQGSFGGPFSNAKLFKTTDGGNTWMDLTDAISPAPIGICGLSVVDEQTVFGCGAFYGPARFYKSLDGGDTWINMDLSAYASALVDVHFFTPDVGFVVGAGSAAATGGILLKTVDGGDTWAIVHNTMIPNDLLWKIQALDNNHLYASIAGVSINDGARILVSEDGGNNWMAQQVFVGEVQLQGVGFLTPDHGFAGGFFEGVYETQDGGDSWTLLEIGANYNRFQTLNDTLMYASGHTIYQYAGEKEMTTALETEVWLPPSYELNLYPNPVKGRLHIDYTLQHPTHVDLGLYDTNGRKVRSFYDGWHSAGEFNITEETHTLPTGLYLVGFLSREGDVLKKVMIEN